MSSTPYFDTITDPLVRTFLQNHAREKVKNNPSRKKHFWYKRYLEEAAKLHCFSKGAIDASQSSFFVSGGRVNVGNAGSGGTIHGRSGHMNVGNPWKRARDDDEHSYLVSPPHVN